MNGEIFVVTGFGHGHLHPCMELCKHLTKRNYHATLIISSNLSSSIPSSFTDNPLTTIAQIAHSGPPMPGSDPLAQKAALDLDALLADRCKVPDLPPPLCTIVDFQMGWTRAVFSKFNIPVISLFTFGASAAAMEWGAWKIQASDVAPGETRFISGLPREMAITYSDLMRKQLGPPGAGAPGGRGGPPKPGDRPPWVPQIEGSIALMFNTCDDLDGPFIRYLEEQMGVAAWGVGPLLPGTFWQAPRSVIRDRQIRGENERESNRISEDEVMRWLDAKARGAVLYVAFGSEVGPTEEENKQLANALEEMDRPFIWAIKSDKGDNHPLGLDKRVGERGLIIRGWAPQLLILSHQSTGAFLSHCGWNSTMEAVGLGVPMLAWPIRGDQHFNAKLVVNYLRVGYRVAEDMSEMVKKYDIEKGIERVMGDEEMRERAEAIKAKFDRGFPATSEASLDAFSDFIAQNTEELMRVTIIM